MTEAGPDRDWAPRFRTVRQGREQLPVIVVDDYAREPERLIEEARSAGLQPLGANFPGVRAPVAEGLKMAFRQSLETLIQATFGIDRPLDRLEAYHSLITTPQADRPLLSRLPHFDGLGANRIAMVHHLGRSGIGGTAFWRHRSTGFETIDEQRLPAYNAAVNRELMAGAEPLSIYEQVALWPARFNRLLIYRGDCLHGADTPADVLLTADPATGRFSINVFWWVDPTPPIPADP